MTGITTTSLYGSQSQHKGMRWWKHLGTSSGPVLIKPSEDEWSFWRDWLEVNYSDIYDHSVIHSSQKQRQLSNILRILNINQKDYFYNHCRGVFFCPLYINHRAFLPDQIKIKKLDLSELGWGQWCVQKSNQRVSQLSDEERLLTESLFNQSMSENDLENWLTSRGVG